MATWAELRERRQPKVLAVAGFALAVLATDRFTHIPYSTDMAGTGPWKVPVGRELVLTGARKQELLTVQTAAGEGMAMAANHGMVEGRDQPFRNLAWTVSPARGETPADFKIALYLAFAEPSPKAKLTLFRSNESAARELRFTSPNAAVIVSGQILTGNSTTRPPTKFHVDGRQAPVPFGPVEFMLLPGGSMSLTLPRIENRRDEQLTINVGSFENLRGSRLRLREVAIRSEGMVVDEAGPDEEATAEDPGEIVRSACSAPARRNFWTALIRSSSAPTGADCDPRNLAITALSIKDDEISVNLAGHAYDYDPDQVASSRWFNWFKNNPLLAAFTGAAFAVYAGFVLKVLVGKKS